MASSTIKIFLDANELSHFAADYFEECALQAVKLRGRFLVSLSGGGTPMALYQLLASSPYRQSLPWERMIFFWGDERCVNQDDPENSYNQAYLAMLAHVPIPETNIFRVKSELDPVEAAAEYARQLRSFGEDDLDWPRFDLVLLGLGADGHTASLFPGSAKTNGKATVAVTAHYEDRPANRISLTPDVFNSARNVVFMVTGVEKAVALSNILTGPRDSKKYPAQRIDPSIGNLFWLVDAAASKWLPGAIKGVKIQR